MLRACIGGWIAGWGGWRPIWPPRRSRVCGWDATGFVTNVMARRCRGCWGSLAGWLLTLPATIGLRSARARLGLSTELVVDEGHEEVERRLSPRRMLEQRLAELPAHERDAIDLRIIDQLGYDEVARRLNIRPAAARLRVSRALGRLRRTVPEEEW